MFKNSIQWLMILLLAFQSVGSMADAHSGHQSGIEHISFEHDHQAMDQIKPLSNLDENELFDCHHCCHCHGAHNNFITAYTHLSVIYARSPQHSFDKPLALSQQPQSLYRPPRS